MGRGGGEKGRNFLTFSRKKETRTRPFPPPRPLCDLVQTTLSLLTGVVVVVRGEKERIGSCISISFVFNITSGVSRHSL